MKKSFSFLCHFIYVFIAIKGSILGAESFATANIRILFEQGTELAISNSPAPLLIKHAKAGCLPYDAIDNSSTYSIITNGNQKKIIAYLDAEMPPGTQLKVMMQPPRHAITNGFVPISVQPHNLITGICNTSTYNLGITYLFSADVRAAPCSHFQRTITYTISQ